VNASRLSSVCVCVWVRICVMCFVAYFEDLHNKTGGNGKGNGDGLGSPMDAESYDGAQCSLVCLLLPSFGIVIAVFVIIVI